jgi:hypothetical protein
MKKTILSLVLLLISIFTYAQCTISSMDQAKNRLILLASSLGVPSGIPTEMEYYPSGGVFALQDHHGSYFFMRNGLTFTPENCNFLDNYTWQLIQDDADYCRPNCNDGSPKEIYSYEFDRTPNPFIPGTWVIRYRVRYACMESGFPD